MFRLLRTSSHIGKHPIISLSIKQSPNQSLHRPLTCISRPKQSVNLSRSKFVHPFTYSAIRTYRPKQPVHHTSNPDAFKAQAWSVNQPNNQPINQTNNQWNTQSAIPPTPSSNDFHWTMIFPYPEFNRSTNRSIKQPIKFLWTSVWRAALETAMLSTSLIVSLKMIAPLMDRLVDRSLDPMMFSMYVSLGTMGLAVLNYMTLATILNKTAWRIDPSTNSAYIQSNDRTNNQSNDKSSNRSKKWSIPASIIVCLGGSFFALSLLPVFGRQSQEEPLIYQMIMQSISEPVNLIFPGFAGPVLEEILFRALYFARLCCVSGVSVGYLLSSLFFGSLHSSSESNKVIDCLIVGGFMCLSYRLSGSLLAPIGVHVLNNSIGSAFIAMFAPDLSPTTLRSTISTALSIQQAAEDFQFEISSRLPVEAKPNPFLTNDTSAGRTSQCVFKPEFITLVDSVFTLLDRDDKGFLKSDEFSFFSTLAPSTAAFLSSAMAVIEQRGESPVWSSIRGEPRFNLPSKHFLGPLRDKATLASQRLYDAVTLPESVLTQQKLPVMQSEALRRLETSPRIFDQQTHRWMDLYYTLFITAAEEARQGDGPAITSRDEFRQECLKFAVLNPNAFATMLYDFTMIAMGTSTHPLAFHDHPVRPFPKTQTKLESLVDQVHLQK